MTDGQTFTPDWFSKPGDSLRALMIRRGVTAQDVADRLAGGIATIKGLLDGTCAINRDHATALAASLGGSASYWLRRQSNYDADLERALDRVPRQRQWHRFEVVI